MTTTSLVAVGLNYRSAPLPLLERLTISPERHEKALAQLGNYEHLLEGVILSTCNRTEVYAAVTRFHGGTQDIRNFLGEFCHLAPEEFSDHLYTYHDDGAVRHLFRVAAGVDSMIVGESEILGQVRRAWMNATEHGAAQRVLGAAFRAALRVGKRARAESGIGHGTVSMSSAAIDLAKSACASGSLAHKRVTVVGTGKMGGLTARLLAEGELDRFVVVGRSLEKAKSAAGDLGEAAELRDLASILQDTDILITATTSEDPVVSVGMLESATAARGDDDPLVVVDIAVPRDVEEGAADLPGVIVKDINDLRASVERGYEVRLSEVITVESMIEEETARFTEWQRSSDVGPTIAALVDLGEKIRATEIGRAKSNPMLDPETLDAVTKRIVAKLLHEPVTKMKALSSSKQRHLYVSALRELFDLDEADKPEL
ncbi:MAG TPA: glutamyl-tRNA reductase [Actinomycetota bacterium]|nr:glutamyl-tRNA reductase [Actinomycetota bacterium]